MNKKFYHLHYLMWLLITVATCISLSKTAMAGDQKTVIWRTTDWPPFYNASGDNAYSGLYDIMIRTYQQRLPEFHHKMIAMTTMRALQQMKNRQNGLAVCHVSMLRRSLTGFAHVSELNSLLPAHVIYSQKNKSNEIRALSDTQDGYVSVKKLFLTESLSGAHTSYGTHAVLEQFKYLEEPLPNITITAENYRNLKELFVNKRVDYIVQYPEFYMTLLDAGMKPEDISIIEIAETRDQFIKVYAGCTKNDIGAEVIEKINTVLAEKPLILQQARLEGLPPKQKDKLRRAYERIAPNLNDY